MKNRFNRHACLEPSVRATQEAQAQRHALRDPQITSMYDSLQWRALKAQVRLEAHGLCEWPGCKAMGHCVDHRIPHKGAPSVFFNRPNLWLLCKKHHDRKTALHDGGFGREVKPLMWPARGPR
jgi:5-methylcytosine-specific restriction enzyme A